MTDSGRPRGRFNLFSIALVVLGMALLVIVALGILFPDPAPEPDSTSPSQQEESVASPRMSNPELTKALEESTGDNSPRGGAVPPDKGLESEEERQEHVHEAPKEAAKDATERDAKRKHRRGK